MRHQLSVPALGFRIELGRQGLACARRRGRYPPCRNPTPSSGRLTST